MLATPISNTTVRCAVEKRSTNPARARRLNCEGETLWTYPDPAVHKDLPRRNALSKPTPPAAPPSPSEFHRQSRARRWSRLFTRTILAAVMVGSLAAARSVANDSSIEEHARAELMAARANYQKARTDPKAAWHVGRACFDVAEIIQDEHERKDLAEEGIEASRQAVALAPDDAPGHYYLALNLGELARSKKLGALKLLQEMEDELSKALDEDPKFDYSGPDRALGMLYLEAPGFPIGIGNRNKARSHLQAAVARNPEFLENRIALAEAYARWGDANQLQSELNRIHAQVRDAQTRFSGEHWAADWRDWTTRIEKLDGRQRALLSNPRAHVGERGVPRR